MRFRALESTNFFSNCMSCLVVQEAILLLHMHAKAEPTKANEWVDVALHSQGDDNQFNLAQL